MLQTVSERHAPSFQVIPRATSGLAILVSCLVLLGWTFNLPTLRSILPGQPQMVPNTAVTFILASVSLWLFWREKRNQGFSFVAWICALAVILIGLLTIGEYLIGSDLGLDGLFFRQKLSATGMSFPGRPSPHTAFNFLLIGIALLLVRTRTFRAQQLGQVFALLGALIASS